MKNVKDSLSSSGHIRGKCRYLPLAVFSRFGRHEGDMRIKKTILAVFCISSASALMYQIVWGRELGYVFGTSMYAVSTILTSFMAGLAIGSYLFGKMVDGHKDPIRLFSYLEIGIGAYGIIIIGLFKAAPYLYQVMYDVLSWNQSIFIFSLFMLSFFYLIIPTTLIGGTFPVIIKIFNNELRMIGKDTGIVYSADNVGACIGIILSGFILMPLWGLSKTAIIAALINIFSGIYLLEMLPERITASGRMEKKTEIHVQS